MQGGAQAQRGKPVTQLAELELHQTAADPGSQTGADNKTEVSSRSRDRWNGGGRRAVRATVVTRSIVPVLVSRDPGQDVGRHASARPRGDRAGDAEIEKRGLAHALERRTITVRESTDASSSGSESRTFP